MRINGTKYPVIEKLPVKALPVRMYADLVPTQVPQVYIRFERYITGKSKINPGYTIKCFQGSNYVIPN